MVVGCKKLATYPIKVICIAYILMKSLNQYLYL
jgi:hypothetical protein